MCLRIAAYRTSSNHKLILVALNHARSCGDVVTYRLIVPTNGYCFILQFMTGLRAEKSGILF